MMKKALFIITCVLIFSVPFRAFSTGEQEFNEYEVKAAFLVNFFKFVEWPSRARDGSAGYMLCIYGSDPFGQYAKALDGSKVRGKVLEVKKVSSTRSLKGCNMLFVSSSERRRLNSVLDTVWRADLLTVGDTDGYAQSGIMVNFFIEEKKVRFEVNMDAIKRANINVSSQLLKLGRIVDNE